MKRTIGQRHRRRGVTLLEVLISTFVLAIGLLGLASLLPVGNMGILAANKADRARACARAGLSHTKVYRLLYPENWSNPTPTTGSFAIDPLGARAGLGSLGAMERMDLNGWTDAQVRNVFAWHDDLAFEMPDDVSLRPRDVGFGEKGHYSWFLTVTPSLVDTEVFLVSVVVCYRRDLQGDTTTVSVIESNGWGGGTLKFTGGGVVDVSVNDWILLYDSAGTTARWYRIVGVSGRPAEFLEVSGADCVEWGGASLNALIVHDVVAVCTTTIELDRYSAWNQ